MQAAAAAKVQGGTGRKSVKRDSQSSREQCIPLSHAGEKQFSRTACDLAALFNQSLKCLINKECVEEWFAG
jgi:hypothetical protein